LRKSSRQSKRQNRSVPQAAQRSAPPTSAQDNPQGQVVFQSQQVATHWMAPYPPPEVMKQIDCLVPNGADRLIAVMERASEFNILSSDRGQVAEIRAGTTGQWMGFFLIIFLACCALLSIKLGAGDLSTCAFLGFPIAYAIKAFISPRDKK